jgi:hypothetical protein
MGARIVVVVLVGTLAVLGAERAVPSGPAGSSAKAAATQSQCPKCPRRATALSLLGQPDALESARPLVEGLRTRFGRVPRKADPVLFVVSARDGPMPATRLAIEALGNDPHGPGAILLVDLAENQDPELQQLVLIEMRDLLRANRVRLAATMPVIRDDDPNVGLLLKGLVSVRCSGGRIVRAI